MAGFNADGTRRIAKAVRQIEQTPRVRVPRPAGPRFSQTAKYAAVTSEIAGATSGGPGKGEGTLLAVTYAADGAGSWSSLEGTVPLYTGGTAPIESGRRVIVDIIDGRWNVVVDYC